MSGPGVAREGMMSEFGALVAEARANHVRWEHEAELLEECTRPLCIGAKVLLWPDIENPRSSALATPPADPTPPAPDVREALTTESEALHASRHMEPDLCRKDGDECGLLESLRTIEAAAVRRALAAQPREAVSARVAALEEVARIMQRHTHYGQYPGPAAWVMSRYAGPDTAADCHLCRALVAAGVLTLDDIGAGTRAAILDTLHTPAPDRTAEDPA